MHLVPCIRFCKRPRPCPHMICLKQSWSCHCLRYLAHYAVHASANTYQFLVSDDENGWVRHARGLERLFEMRGPETMASLPCLMILEKTRPSLIFAGLVLHKRTIMSKVEWKRDPWCMHPERVDSLKLLFDILADCPLLSVLRD
jgi:hypothetical protein